MDARNESINPGLDRLNAMFVWWGIPNTNGNGQFGQFKRFQAFTNDLGKVCSEAYSRQMGSLLDANGRIASSLQEFARCRQPPDVVAAELSVLATVLEQASLQAKASVELLQQVQDRCSAMAREVAEDLRQQAL
jgi:hypothetical protein